jgi:hypothetical protein
VINGLGFVFVMSDIYCDEVMKLVDVYMVLTLPDTFRGSLLADLLV